MTKIGILTFLVFIYTYSISLVCVKLALGTTTFLIEYFKPCGNLEPSKTKINEQTNPFAKVNNALPCQQNKQKNNNWSEKPVINGTGKLYIFYLHSILAVY